VVITQARAAAHAAQPHRVHQPLDGTAGNPDTLAAKLSPPFSRPVHLVVVIPDPLDRCAQLVIGLRSRRSLVASCCCVFRRK
jgi:hypothetical protein